MNKYKLEDLCEIKSGGTPRRSRNEFFDGDILWAKIGDISSSDGVIYETEERITEEGLENINNRMFKKGTLLFSMYGSIGKVAIAGKDMSTNQAILGINIKDPSRLDQQYLNHWFTYKKKKLENETRGVTLKNLSATKVKNLDISLPPLETQKKIAAVLDKADTLRQKRRQTIEKLDALTRSVFLDMFGDPVANPHNLSLASIKELTTKVSSGSTPKGGSDVYQDEGIQFIRSQNVQMNYLDLSDVAHISMEIHDDMQRTKVKNGDVLLNITGASIGRVAVFRGEDNSANVNQHVCIIRPITEKILPEYLSLVLSNTSYQKQILGRNAGATRQAFNYTQIKGFDIPLPPISKQQELVRFLKRYRSTQQNFQSSERQLDNLFNSLLQKAFKVELNFNDTEEPLLAAEEA